VDIGIILLICMYVVIKHRHCVEWSWDGGLQHSAGNINLFVIGRFVDHPCLIFLF
jgi:hypothetical protein